VRVVFRTDASILIGTGHVMRCLTLADELNRQGHECSFVCRALQGHLGDLIADKGYDLILLPTPTCNEMNPKTNNPDSYSVSLGVSWQDDAAQTLEAIGSLKLSWLVIDHYALDAKWERKLASAAEQIIVIDDLANRSHECTVLLDQNVLDQCVKQQYQKLVNENCLLLLGPKYALLRWEYADLAIALPQRDGVIARVLVFVGGSDPYQLTEQYLHALDAPKFRHLFVDVVIGKNHPAPITVKCLVESRPRTRLYSGLTSLAALMVRADLMLGAGGATTWERMCLGLNSVVVSVAENQDQLSQKLLSRGLIHFLGNAEQINLPTITKTLNEIVESPDIIRTCSDKMRELVDGQGCKRVVYNLVNQSTL
jgi:UDP-2,4-diacetamido-2,4,6-trideoxy-beta-L-altropyranose hydrolase